MPRDSTTSPPDMQDDVREIPDGFEEVPAPSTGIKFFQGDISHFADRAEIALIRAGAEIYQSAGRLVRPGFAEVEGANRKKTRTASLFTVDAVALQDELARHTRWVVPLHKSLKRIDPPLKICRALMSRTGRWRFPHVAGVLTCPTLRPDGSILSAPGYDLKTKLYLILDKDFALPKIPDRPSREDAMRALALLKGLFAEFPFVDDSDRSVALSLVLSTVCRATLGVVPLHAFTAPAPGSGKSYISDIVSAIIAGRPAPVIAAGGDEIEMEKRLAAKLIAGVPFISIDNLNGTLSGDLLCQIAERPSVSVRILGKSETPEFSFRGILTANGNNLVIAGDMTRRVLLARLDAGMERPELRQFSGDPVGRLMQNRGAYIAAAMTVVRAYQIAGAPDAKPTLASYHEWSTLVRSALCWLGEADVAETMERARASDPITGALAPVLVAWRAALGNESLTAAQVITRLQSFDPGAHGGEALIALRQALEGVAATRGVLDATRLGNFLRRHRDRVIDRLRFVGNLTRDKVIGWSVASPAPRSRRT